MPFRSLVILCVPFVIIVGTMPAEAEDQVQKVGNRVEVLEAKMEAELDAADRKTDAKVA